MLAIKYEHHNATLANEIKKCRIEFQEQEEQFNLTALKNEQSA